MYVLFVYKFSFFFSSRRRHTRLQGDWSSDVCSSDLQGITAQGITIEDDVWIGSGAIVTDGVTIGRSEERRVGKECRSWRTSECYKKKKGICTYDIDRRKGYLRTGIWSL